MEIAGRRDFFTVTGGRSLCARAMTFPFMACAAFFARVMRFVKNSRIIVIINQAPFKDLNRDDPLGSMNIMSDECAARCLHLFLYFSPNRGTMIV